MREPWISSVLLVLLADKGCCCDMARSEVTEGVDEVVDIPEVFVLVE